MNYKEFEKTVFDWLMKKHKKNNNFTFSFRQKATKGAELDYFIGTENSHYLGTTFWTIPIGYPGASGDLIDLFLCDDDGSYRFYIEFNQTKKPHDSQNKHALGLIKNLKPIIKKNFKDSYYESKKETKYERYSILEEKSKSSSVDSLLKKLDKELMKVLELVDKEILKLTTKYKDFNAHPISEEEFQSMIEKMGRRFEKYKGINPEGKKEGDGTSDSKEELENTNSNYPNPNIILYGPPGTGKTYNTVGLAYELINLNEADNHKEAQDFFKQERGKYIEFITFHQNYAYEDFVQGLKPDSSKEQLQFKKVDGIFMNICTNALFEYYIEYIKQLPKKTAPDFNVIFNSFIDWLKSSGLDTITFKTKEGNPIKIKDIGRGKYIHAVHGESDVIHTVSRDRLEKLYNSFDDIDQVKNIIKDITRVIGGSNASMYWTFFNELLKFEDRNIEDLHDVETEIFEDEAFDTTEKKRRIYELGLNKLSEFIEINKPAVPNYVLIIDEINRANISRVFGELITLLEKDKRLGEVHEIRVELSTGDEFAIPPNLYIIGTMNTADKSIALVDIALRRRFEFRKKYPLYEIEGHEIQHAEKLKKVNQKIRELKGADFQIGHSYFMDDDFNLEYTMNNKVIPLLYEYFMNDTDSVKDVLKAGGFKYIKENKTNSGLIEFTEVNTEDESSEMDDKKE